MKLIIYILPFLTFAQSNGRSPEQFAKELSNMTQDLSIVNDCDSSERYRFVLDTLNMNNFTLELFNIELIVKKIINPGDIILRCGSVTIEISENRKL